VISFYASTAQSADAAAEDVLDEAIDHGRGGLLRQHGAPPAVSSDISETGGRHTSKPVREPPLSALRPM